MEVDAETMDMAESEAAVAAIPSPGDSSEETLDVNTGLPVPLSLSLFDESQESQEPVPQTGLCLQNAADDGSEQDFTSDSTLWESSPRPSKRACLGFGLSKPGPVQKQDQCADGQKDGVSDFDLNESQILSQIKEPEALKNLLQTAPKGLSPPCFDEGNVQDKPILAWVKPLLKFFQKKLKGVTWKKTLRMSTVCSGTGAPKHALCWMGVPVLEVFSADPKRAVTTMLHNCDRMHGPLYHFQTVKDILQREGWCSLHAAHVQVPIGRSHLFVAGFPCAPFSTQRPARWAEGGWQAHKESETMKDVGTAVRQEEPLLVVLENVPGFVRKSRPGPASPKIWHS